MKKPPRAFVKKLPRSMLRGSQLFILLPAPWQVIHCNLSFISGRVHSAKMKGRNKNIIKLKILIEKKIHIVSAIIIYFFTYIHSMRPSSQTVIFMCHPCPVQPDVK